MAYKCKMCGGSIEDSKESSIAFCQYCGTRLELDNEIHNYSYTYTKRDEARIREAERKERIQLKTLENKEKESKRKYWASIITPLAGIFLFLGLFYFLIQLETPRSDEIRIPCAMADYKGEQYEVVIQELEDLGFSNIETAEKKDLVTGWITKEGSVYKVSIGGDSDFEEGDIFKKDAEVVVTYHAFKD